MQIHSASQGRSHSFLYRANQKGDWLHWFRINLKRMQSPHTGLCLKSSVKSLQMLPAQRKRGSAPAKGLELTRSISLLFLFFLSRWDFWLCSPPPPPPISMSGHSPHRKSPFKKTPSRKWPQVWAATDGGSFPNLAWWEGRWPADSQVADSYPMLII